MNKKQEKRAFKKGWLLTTIGNSTAVRNEIMTALGITTKSGFYFRMSGRTNNNPVEINAIEAIFKKYGIDNPWGLN